jgi:hypothetical protein
MSNDLRNIVVSKFFDFYKSDLESEYIDSSNVVLSFPVHFSGFHRIEITITQLDPNRFIISDGAKTLEELRNAGYALNTKLKKRLELISRSASIRVVNDHLVAESNADLLGSSIQRFLEAAKTIGDAYLVQRASPSRDSNLMNRVSEFLATQQVLYQPKHSIRGKIENHTIDFYFPPNGVPGLALSVMNNPTRQVAEAWAFKSSDIQRVDERIKVGVVYEDEDAGDSSKSILNGIADVSVPGSDIAALRQGLLTIGILKRA